MIEQIGIVVGAATLTGTEEALLEDLRAASYVVAADGGMDFFIKHNILPDLWLGDMDSSDTEVDGIKERFPELNIETYPVKKDDTDMALALAKIFSAGCSEAHIYGGLGGERPEHSLANIQLMHYYGLKDRRVVMHSDKNVLYTVSPENPCVIEGEAGRFVSVFSLSELSEEVSIKDLLYEYEGEMKSMLVLGISNETIGKKGRISVGKGVLLIVENKS